MLLYPDIWQKEEQRVIANELGHLIADKIDVWGYADEIAAQAPDLFGSDFTAHQVEELFSDLVSLSYAHHQGDAEWQREHSRVLDTQGLNPDYALSKQIFSVLLSASRDQSTSGLRRLEAIFANGINFQK